MYLTVVFVILFKISFGLHLNFGLAQLLHDLGNVNAPLFKIDGSKESKQTKSDNSAKLDIALNSSLSTNDGISENLKISTGLNGSSLEDTLKSVSDKTTKVLGGVLDDTLGSVGGKADKSLSIGVLDKTLESVVENAGKASNRGIVEKTLQSVGENDEKNGGVVGKISDSIGEKVSASLSGDVLSDSLGTVSGKDSKVLPDSLLGSAVDSISDKGGNTSADQTSVSSSLGDTLGGISEKADKALKGSVSESVSNEAGKTSDVSILTDSLKSLPENAGKVPQVDILDSLQTVSGKASKTLDDSMLGDSIKALPEKSDEALKAIDIGGSLEIDSAKASKSLTGSIVEDSFKNIQVNSGKNIDTSILKDSVKAIPTKVNKALDGGAIEDLEILNEKTGKPLDSMQVSLGIVAEKAGKILPGSILEDPLGKVSGKSSKSVNVDISGITKAVSNSQGTLKDGIQLPVVGNKASLNKNIEVSIGEKCTTTGLLSVPAVSQYIKTFRKSIHSSELLTVLFDVTDATPLQLSQFKYRLLVDFFRKLGFMDANDIATLAVRFITQYFKVLLEDVLEKVYSTAFAFYLLAEGVLTIQNADQLALDHIKAMEENAKANQVVPGCDVIRKLQATGDGNVDFLLSLGQLSRPRAWEIALYYSHAWLLTATDQGAIGVVSVIS